MSSAESVGVQLYFQMNIGSSALRKIGGTLDDLTEAVRNFEWLLTDEMNKLVTKGAIYGEAKFKIRRKKMDLFRGKFDRVGVSSLRETLANDHTIREKLMTSVAAHAIVVELRPTSGKIWKLNWVLMDLRRKKVGMSGDKWKGPVNSSDDLDEFFDTGAMKIAESFGRSFPEYIASATTRKIILISCFWHSIISEEGDDREERLTALQNQIPAWLADKIPEELKANSVLKGYVFRPMQFTGQCAKFSIELQKKLFKLYRATLMVNGNMDMRKAKNTLYVTLQLVPFSSNAMSYPWDHGGPDFDAKNIAWAMAPMIADKLEEYFEK